MNTLFDTSLPERAWTTIAAQGFEAPVPGALFRGSRKPCCGVPLGGIGTGCVDIDASGAWGYNSMFNGYTFNTDSTRVPRVAPSLWPILGLAVDGQVCVLATQEIVDGGLVPCCTEPFVISAKAKAREPVKVLCQDIKGVKAAQDIIYFGHYPVADIEYITDAPVSVGLRAWAPFIPGPGAEVNSSTSMYASRFRSALEVARRMAADHGALLRRVLSWLREFYESLKACNSYVMGPKTGNGGPVSMPTKGPKSGWFEFIDWDGICAHMGGIRLAQLQIMRRLAEHVGDTAYAERCRAWFKEGSDAIEKELWTGSSYLNFVVKETGRVSDEVMAYQNVGQWMSAYHGFDGVFDHARVKTALATVKRINIPITPAAGAANFARPDAKLVDEENKIAFYGSAALFVAEATMLGMVFMIEGQRDYGMEFIRKFQHNNALVQGHQWDLPCIMRGDTGERNTGTDYYRNMMSCGPKLLPRPDAAVRSTQGRGFWKTSFVRVISNE